MNRVYAKVDPIVPLPSIAIFFMYIPRVPRFQAKHLFRIPSQEIPYARYSILHHLSVANLFTPPVLTDGFQLIDLTTPF